MNELWTYKDIAKETGVSEGVLRVWRSKGSMPPPDVQPNPKVALWRPDTILRWWEERNAT